jgi:hypothetical protein
MNTDAYMQSKKEDPMENKDLYTLAELFENLPVSLSELARQSGLNEVTLARVRDGRAARRDSANKLLRGLSKVYERPLSLHNVTGIRLQGQEERETTAA